MKRNNDLQKWGPFSHGMNDHDLNKFPFPSQDVQQTFGQMLKDIEKWFHPKHWDALFQQMNQQLSQQVQLQEHDDAYYVTVRLDDIENPDDVQVQLHGNFLRLQRIVQHEMKKNNDYGAIWKTSYQHFERTIPLAEHVDWQGREIQAQKGIWMIKLPKK